MLISHTEVQTILLDVLLYIGINIDIDSKLFTLVSLASILLLAILSYLIARFILFFKVARLIALTKSQWDDQLMDHGVFRRLSHLVPGIVMYSTKSAFFDPSTPYFSAISMSISLYLIITVFLVIQASLTAAEAIYKLSELAKKAPITGFVQVARLLVTLGVIFMIISLLLDKSPIYLLSGLTAVAAVLLLIFRDTILGFVAGIQIAANRMFNTGDWIEIPKYGVDGDITQIGLNVVKVQNWDKTISTIPTYSLISDAVKNWRGMQESGGRRIKRAIHIDMRSINFADTDMLAKWRKLKLLKSYLAKKENELEQDAERCQKEAEDLVNSRKLTNIGTFRAYVSAYISAHPDINKELTCMVRQLKPSEIGLPLEIYCFSANKDWVAYEHIQSEIFDHLLAILPLFELSPYQRVTNDKSQAAPEIQHN